MYKFQKQFPWIIVLFFVVLKLLIHFFTNTNYELHRDAFLYIAHSDHPAWGYLSVPPLTPILIKIIRSVFGDSVFSIRLLPALFGSASIIFISLIVKELGGKRWALILANTAFIFSIAYLRSNTLLQPVPVNQFFWLTAFYFILKLLKTEDPKYWWYISINFGLGFLNKYSIAFLAFGFFISLVSSPHRYLLIHKHFIFSLLTGILIVSPNLIWQFNHQWPVLYHMELLQKYQLVHVHLKDFLFAQLLMNLNGIFLWMTGLIFLLFHPSLKSYRALGLTVISVMIIIILGRGKSYYTLGLYPFLFACGGFVFEKYLEKKSLLLSQLLFSILVVLPLLPLGLPIYKHDKMLGYCQGLINMGFDMPMRWEDGEIHSLPQDFADMIGWKELADVVVDTFYGISENERRYSYIYADNYGQAGAIRFYGKKQGLPEPICFHGSFVLWAPNEVSDLKYLIFVSNSISEIRPLFENIIKVGEITNPYARESGLPVWLCKNPDEEFYKFYKHRVSQEKGRFLKNRKL